jgi:23S rRNA pseudouridine2605 synthase
VEARAAGDRRWHLELTLTEGRNREVRRLCEAVGLTLDRLVRVRFGPVTLGTLAPGALRPLTDRERTLVTALARGTPDR